MPSKYPNLEMPSKYKNLEIHSKYQNLEIPCKDKIPELCEAAVTLTQLLVLWVN